VRVSRFRPSRSISSSQTNEPPFTSFFERQKLREERDRGRRRIIIASIIVHVLVFGTLAILAALNVDELFSTNVTVSVASMVEDEEGALVSGAAVKNKPRVPRTNAESVTGLHLRVSGSDVIAVSVPVVAGTMDPAVVRYLRVLQTEVLEPVLRYPVALRAVALRATLTLRLAIGRDGKVVEASIKPPCPHEGLCEAVLASVAHLGSLGIHDGALGDPWYVSVPIEFAYPGLPGNPNR
jgi:hypothetical protein